MATLTSSQSGNWSSSSTWGGSTPADGDTFTISAGHIVTINSDVRTTNGTGNVNVNGKLIITSGGKIRVNGILDIFTSGTATSFFSEGVSTSGAHFEMQNNTDLELVGLDADNHGIQVEDQVYLQIVLQGSEKNLNTLLSGEHSYQQDYLSVDSASNFAAGDWLTVFKRDVDYRVNTDEGFFVHDVDTSNNRIYLRQFVSPTATIESVSGSTITVDEAKVFRVGYKIIFGTGNNRNVKTITAIKNNVITCDSAISGSSITGLTVYQTGNEKKHVDDSIVKRMATTLTTAISTADSTNQIVVGNASDISVGDKILIDVNNDTNTNWDYDGKYEVTAKSGNTLTLDDQVRYVHKVGSIVTILTRDCHVHTNGSSDQRVYVWVHRWTSSNGYKRRLRYQNVHFEGIGRNDNSVWYGGVGTHGYLSINQGNSSDDGRNYETRIDSCVYDSPTYRSTYSSFFHRDSHFLLYRNCISYNAERGFWAYSSNYDLRMHNCYATRQTYAGFPLDSTYGEFAAFGYLYATRTDDYAMTRSHVREQHQPMRHLIFLNNEQRGFYTFYSSGGNNVIAERILQDGYRYPPYIGASGGPRTILDSKFYPNKWDGTAEDGSGQVYSNYVLSANNDGRNDYDRSSAKQSYCEFIDHGFKEGEFLQMSGANSRVWKGDYWDVTVGDDANHGFFESAYVPAGATARISCEVQCASSGSFTRPYLVAKSHRGGSKMGAYECEYDTTLKTSTQSGAIYAPNEGFRERIQYTPASDGAWEEKQLTVQPQKYNYILITGVYTASTNIREEGYKMKNININISKGVGFPVNEVIIGKRRPQIRSGFNSAKKRISGRL